MGTAKIHFDRTLKVLEIPERARVSEVSGSRERILFVAGDEAARDTLLKSIMETAVNYAKSFNKGVSKANPASKTQFESTSVIGK